jgi:hypothetical protein
MEDPPNRKPTNSNMKIVTSAILLAAIISIGISCQQNTGTNPEVNAISKDSLVVKGKYLVEIAGCNHCHTPKVMGAHGPELDSNKILSGYPSDRPVAPYDSNTLKSGWILFNYDLTSAVGPWGQSFAANISSDPTGIGNWTEEQFVKAFQQGKFMGSDEGRMLLPPMPWQGFAYMKKDDVQAIFAYLKSTKPVHNVVPAARMK